MQAQIPLTAPIEPLIPMDPLCHVITQMVTRFSLSERGLIEALPDMEPLPRVLTMLKICAGAAQRDPKIKELLATPGVMSALRRIAVERQAEQQEAACENPAQPA